MCDEDYPALIELADVRPMTPAELDAAAEAYQREAIETAQSEATETFNSRLS